MKVFRQVMRVALAATSCLLIATGSAYADTVNVKADLMPSTEVPPNTTTGHGDLTGTFDTSTKVLQWKVDYDGLSGPATMAHFPRTRARRQKRQGHHSDRQGGPRENYL